MASRAAILDLDHVQVAVPPGAEDVCRAFYVTLLGMPEIAKPQALVAHGGVWVQAGKRQLHLGVEKEFQPARKAHPAFAVSDIDDLAQRVAHEGRDVVWDNETIPGLRRFHTHDPFGNRLEFVESQDVSNR
ncbi:MAG: glyoxalase [Rhizobiales bacterium]|nr:glyoxalase [Hyphomicrobiales bacterium]